MRKDKYTWTKTISDDKIGTIKFSTGSFRVGNLDIHDLRQSRLPEGGLPLTIDEWDRVNRGEKVTKAYYYTKTFEIEKTNEEE